MELQLCVVIYIYPATCDRMDHGFSRPVTFLAGVSTSIFGQEPHHINSPPSPPGLPQHHHNCDTATIGRVNLVGVIESTTNLFALPGRVLLMESNPPWLFALQHALQHSLHNTEIDCKPALRHTESFSYLAYRKRKR